MMGNKFFTKIKTTIGKYNIPFKRNVLIYVLTAGLLIFGVYFLSLNKNVRNTVALATTVKPESFTEIYFENHTTLPATVKKNQTINFSFTVHNLENNNFNYKFLVYIEIHGKRRKIDSGKFTIPQNGYKTISETVTLTQPFVRGKVDVNLTNLNQNIFFWLQEKATNEKK